MLNDHPTRADTSLFQIKQYFGTEFKSVIEEINKMLTLVKHTLLHSFFSNKKITPATMVDLLHKVEQRLQNMKLLIGKAVDTVELVQKDFLDNMINAQATEEDYQDMNKTTRQDLFN